MVSRSARFCSACGASLGTAGRRTEPATAPRAYTPRHLAEEILTQRAAMEGERKQVTVLFADLKGSMELAADVDPEEWHAIMDRFFGIASACIHRYEGTVNQYTGDGVMALFGAPLAHEDHAERACLAALDLATSLARYGDELRRERGLPFAVRVGLNSGEVVVGRIGDDLRMDYTAQGHTVGLAARMEQLAEPGTAYLTEHTQALVGDRFALRDLGPHNVRGVREPVRVFVLEGVGASRTRLARSRARGFSRFVGRASEAGRLEAALDRARAGSGGVVAVCGEAGVGKSRLCFELASRARACGVAVHEAHAVTYGRAVPLVPVLELLRSMLGIGERDSPEEARRKAAGTLLLVDVALHGELPLVFDLLGVADPQAPAARAGDPEARQRRLLGIVRRLLEHQAARRPQLLLVEDLHWIDPRSEDFLRAIADAVPRSQALLIVNYRPEYEAESDWLAALPHERIALAPLGADEVHELLFDLLGGDPSLGDLGERIVRRTAGNPFFVEETVRALADAGHVEGRRGAFRAPRPVAEVSLPVTVQAVLAARIDRLPEAEKSLLQTAAVIGERFDAPVLARLCGQAEDEIARGLDALVRAEFVHHDGDQLAFNHPLTQEVAYRSQLAARREQVHAAVAAVLEELHGGAIDEVAALLAHHRECAGDARGAARWLRRAAERATRNDVAEAVRLWTRAGELAASLPESPETVEIGVWAGIQRLNLGWRSGLDAEEAQRIFSLGMELAKRVPDHSAQSGFLVTYGAVQGLAGKGREALALIREAARLAEQAGDEGIELAIRCALVQSQIMVGAFREALVSVDDALARTRSAPGLGNAQTGFDTHAWLLTMRGGLKKDTGDLLGAERDLDDALERALGLGETEILGWAHEMRGNLARWATDPAPALAHARQAVELAERIGSPFSQASAYGALGLAYRIAGDVAGATRTLEHATRIIRERHAFVHWEAGALALLAEAYEADGRFVLAEEKAREAIALAARRNTRFVELMGRLARATALVSASAAGAAADVSRAAHAGAAHELDEAGRLAEETGASSWQPLIDVQRARLARGTGDAGGWQALLARAARGFAAIGAAGLAREPERALRANVTRAP